MLDFDLTTGFVYLGSSQILLNEIIPKLSKFNPKTTTLLFLTDKFSSDLVTKIFQVSWDGYKIHDVFIVFHDEFDKYFEPFSIYTFNTFHQSSPNQLVEILFHYNYTVATDTLQKFKVNRYRDLHGYRLKVVLFQFMMVCSGTEYKNGSFDIESLKFQDAEALKILSKIANFTIEFVKSADGVKHGYQTSNFTFTGSLGMVEYEQADFAANARLLAEYNTSNTLCLFPTTSTKLKFAVPKKLWKEVNILVSLYNFLDNSLKISFLVIFIVLPILIYVFDYLSVVRKHKIESLGYNYLMFYSVMTFVSIKLPQLWPSRFILGSVIIVWLIVGNTYAGKMIEFLNTSFGLKQIGSIKELTKTSLEVKVPYPMAILFEGNFENATDSHLFINKVVKKSRAMESVGDKMAFIDVENMGEMIRSRKYALLFLDNLIELLEKSFHDENGNDILTHIEETPYEYYYAMSVPKTSPFVQIFNEILMHIFEAGISKYQMSLAKGETDLIYVRRVKNGKIQSNTVKSISLDQLYSVFYYLLCGLAVSLLVFIVELIVRKLFK